MSSNDGIWKQLGSEVENNCHHFRKWLPNIRKLSQGRGDKALSSEAAKVASNAGAAGINRDSNQKFKVTTSYN